MKAIVYLSIPFFNHYLFIYLLINNYTTYRKNNTVHYLRYLQPNTTISARNGKKRKKTERKPTFISFLSGFPFSLSQMQILRKERLCIIKWFENKNTFGLQNRFTVSQNFKYPTVKMLSIEPKRSAANPRSKKKLQLLNKANAPLSEIRLCAEFSTNTHKVLGLGGEDYICTGLMHWKDSLTRLPCKQVV